MYQTVRAAAVLLTDCTASVVFVVVSLNSHFMSWVGWVKYLVQSLFCHIQTFVLSLGVLCVRSESVSCMYA